MPTCSHLASHAAYLLDFSGNTDKDARFFLFCWQKTNKVVSQDSKSNLDHTKSTTLLDILPLCRDDLVVVDRK